MGSAYFAAYLFLGGGGGFILRAKGLIKSSSGFCNLDAIGALAACKFKMAAYSVAFFKLCEISKIHTLQTQDLPHTSWVPLLPL